MQCLKNNEFDMLGPVALCEIKPLSSLSMPSAEMLISGILG